MKKMKTIVSDLLKAKKGYEKAFDKYMSKREILHNAVIYNINTISCGRGVKSVAKEYLRELDLEFNGALSDDLEITKYCVLNSNISNKTPFKTLQKLFKLNPTNSQLNKHKKDNFRTLFKQDIKSVKSLDVLEKEIHILRETKKRLFSDSLRTEIYLRDKAMCQICGTFVTIDNYDCDHIIPFSKGGETSLNNGQCTCKKCNRSKGNRV